MRLWTSTGASFSLITWVVKAYIVEACFSGASSGSILWRGRRGWALVMGSMVTCFGQFSLDSSIMACVFNLSHLFHFFQSKRTSRGTAVDLHYWIGKDSSQDEQGAAAMYVTQLDAALRGSPVQHREVQGHESETFQSYFRNGIMWVASDPLLQCYGCWGSLCFSLSQRPQHF